MQPNEFISEVYRRGAVIVHGGGAVLDASSFIEDLNQAQVDLYADLLPENRNASIVDIGSGNGEFLAACVQLGYTNITAADFRAKAKLKAVCDKYQQIAAEDYTSSIAEHFGKQTDQYDVIHFAHIIEHVYKYELLETMDGLFKCLKPGGTIIIRTPNMEGPSALSSLYVTLTHEYGFTGANLKQLLMITRFTNIIFYDSDKYLDVLRRTLRAPFKMWQKFKSRLFGVNLGGCFGGELVVTAQKANIKQSEDE